MFKKYMCLALCLLMALGTMSTTASAASAADALTASYVSFSDANGPITDLPASASTVTASVTVSNNSASASSVVLWVGKYVDEVLTDIKYTEAEVAAGAQNTPVSVSMDNVAKDEVTSGSTTYDRTVLKAYVWTGLIGGRALAPIATIPSDDLSILYAKKDGKIWTEFDSNKKYQVSVIDPTEQIPQYEFFVNDNATKLEAPAKFGFGDNVVTLTSAKGNKDTYTFNFVDGSEVAGAFLYDNYEEYPNNAMNSSKWGSLVNGYLNNMKLLQKPDGNTYVSIFGTDGQQYPRLEKHLTDANGKAPDYNREIIIKSKAMIQDDAPGANPVTADILARRAMDKSVGILNMNSNSVKLFGVEFGKGITNGVWFNFEIRLKIDPVTYDVTATAVLTGDGLKDKAGQPTTELKAEGKSNIAKAEPGNSLPIMFNTGHLAKDNGAAKSINYDDTIMMYAPEASSNTNIGSLTYTANGTTTEVTDFEPNVASGEYTISVPEGTSEVTLNVEPYEVRNATAEVYVDGVKKDGGVIALTGEPVDATIKITAQDGTVNENFTVHITFGGGVVLSKNAKLSALTYQYGDKQPETVPGFSSADEDKDYGTIMLPNDTKSVTVGATTQHEKANAVITIDDGTPEGKPVENGVVAVSRGAETVVKVTVTPEDKEAKKNVYTVAFKVKDPIVLTSDTLEVGTDIVLIDEPMSAALQIYNDRDWLFTTLGTKIKESNFFVRTNARTTMEKYAGSGDMFSFVAPEDGRLYLLSPDACPPYADAGWKLLSSSAPVGPDGTTKLDATYEYKLTRDVIDKTAGQTVSRPYFATLPYNYEPNSQYYAAWAQTQSWDKPLFREEIAQYEAGQIDYAPIFVENDNAYDRTDKTARDGKSLHYCYSLEFKQGDTVKVPFFVSQGGGAKQDPPFLVVNWGTRQANTTSYVLDETNGALVSANPNATVETLVVETGANTYEYAKGISLGSAPTRTQEYVLNGEGKNMGYKWTLSSANYAPGTYDVYVKGTSYGSDASDTFYLVYDEKTCSPDVGISFAKPWQDDPLAHKHLVYNWIQHGQITVPANGSATLRIMGRENPFVDKVMLISAEADSDYTIEKAEEKLCAYYDAAFTNESGATLATVKYESGLVGTMVPESAYYITEENGANTVKNGTVSAFVVPEKEGMIAAWKPATLQADGTTFVPEYTAKPAADVLFSDDFEGYTDLFVDDAETAVPDTRKWTGVYKYNTLLKKDSANTYVSIFPGKREDNGQVERYPRITKLIGDYDKTPLRVSGRIMRQNGAAVNPSFNLEVLGTGNTRSSWLQISNGSIELFKGESIGKAEAGKWIDFDLYVTYGGTNGDSSEALVILEGEGLTDKFGNATNRITAKTACSLADINVTNSLNFYFNTSFTAEEAAASINLDNVEIVKNPEIPALADNAKLSSLTYTTDKAAATAVPGFDPANEGGTYTVDLPAGTTSVKLEGVPADAAAKGGAMFNGQTLADGTIAVTDGSSSTVTYVVVAESGKTNRFDVTFKVSGEMKNRVTNLKTASAQGVYTDNEGYIIGDDKQTSVVSNGKYAVMDGLIPGVTTRYGAKGDEGRVVNADTHSYFDGATVIKAARYDRNSSPAGKWANQKYYSSADYDGKDGHGYWLEFTVSDDCTVFQVAFDGLMKDAPWINAPADWTKNSKSGFRLDGSNNFYYKEYKAGETVQIPNYGVYDQWTNESAWYEAPGWYIVWKDSGKVNPDTLDGNAKLSSLTYQFNGDAAATAVPGFDAANEGGNYEISIPAGKNSVTVAAAPVSVGKTEVTVKVGGEVVPDGVVTLASNKLTIVEVASVAEDKATAYTFAITFMPEGLAVGEVTEITQGVVPSDSKNAVRADTIVFGTTSPYVRYSVGDEFNGDGSNLGAAIYTADNSPSFFEGATAVRRDKMDAVGSNKNDGPTANYWGKPDFDGKDGHGYWLTFKVSEAGTVYVVDREGKGWPNKPADWSTSKYTTGGKTMYYKKVAAGETVQIPNYGWNDTWTTQTTDRAFKDPSYYVVVWGTESPEDYVNKTANLKRLQYQVGDTSAVDVPGFNKADEGKPEGYDPIELPEGTAQVKVLASASDLATYVVEVGGAAAADGVVTLTGSSTEVLVKVTSEDKAKTNTFKLTFTVAGAAATETVVIYDNFEDYGEATTIDKNIKGWVSVKEPNISLNRTLDPGNTVAEVKKVGAEQWPSLHKHITVAPEDIFVISGKVRLDSVGDVEPSHYIEMRDPVWPHTTKSNTLSISSSNISILGRKIAEGESGKWVTYKMYMIRGAEGEKTQYIVELTGEGLKDASGTPTERVVAANAAQLDGLYITENEVKIMFNHDLGNSDDTRVYLDELKIAKVDTAPDFVFSNDAKLQSLTYAPNGENAKGVEDFSSTDEGKPEGYASIELPYGTTTVTVGATPVKGAWYVVKPKDKELPDGVVKVSTDAATEVLVVVTSEDGMVENTFKLTFTVSNVAPPVQDIKYLLDETNGTALEAVTPKTTVIETGASTYEYAKGFSLYGVTNRTEDSVLNGEDKGKGISWTLSSADYKPGEYNVYVKGTSYGSGSADSFYVVYNESAIDSIAGLMFKAPKDNVTATHELMALNWVKGGKTVTIPEAGSATLRVLGREGGGFVDKVILVAVSDGSDIVAAESDLCTSYDALFKSEDSSATLATVKYDSALVGTMVPSTGWYLNTDTNLAVEGAIAALSVPKKAGFTGAWSPDKLAADGTTFTPVYTPIVVDDFVFFDDFEGYGDEAAYPDNSKWSNATGYKDNLKLIRDNGNTYVSVFPAGTQQWPRLDKSDVDVDITKTLHFSGKAMVKNDTQTATATVEIRRADCNKNYAARLMSMSTGSVKVLDGISIGKLPEGKWVNYDVYLTIGAAGEDSKVIAVVTGEGLIDAEGKTVSRIHGEGTKNLDYLEIRERSNKIGILLNTGFGAVDKAEVCADDYKVDYADAPAFPNTKLASLTYNGAIVPDFSAVTRHYTIYTLTADPVAIAAVAEDTANAKVEIDKASLTPSVAGDKATITVTNGDETSTYTVTVMLMPEKKIINMKVASPKGVYNSGKDLPGYGPVDTTSGQYMISENLQVGAYGNADRADKGVFKAGTSDYFLGATYIRPLQAEAGGNNKNPIFTGAFDGKNGNPYWLEFTVSSAATVYYASCNGAWTNRPDEWNAASATDDLTLMIGSSTVSPAKGNLYSRHYEAGERVQIPNFGVTSNAAPWESPAHYIIVWDSDKEDPDGGIDDGGEHGTGNGGGWEDGGNN